MKPTVGVYEKSLPESDLASMLASTRDAGYDFFELAIDESPHRIRRLDWSAHERTLALRSIQRTSTPIAVITLSAHRAVPLGSASRETRSQAKKMLMDAIQLAADLDAAMVQVAGYYVFYEPHHHDARPYFLEGLHDGCVRAHQVGISLGLENVDGQDILSVGDGLAVIDEIGHPALGLHVDVGNLAGNRNDVIANLTLAMPHLGAIDLKDARPGIFRRVQFGQGSVPFAEVFATLDAADYRGPYAVEMWNDNATTVAPARDALDWLLAQRCRQGQ